MSHPTTPPDSRFTVDATKLALAELPFVADKVQNIIRNDGFARTLQPPALQQSVLAYPMRTGKMLRPALVLWSCGAVGGVPDVAIPAAAAVELFHTWTLVHDDIIDGDATRRGQPSAHCLAAHLGAALHRGMPVEERDRYGVNMAILAGDVQQAWANRLMLRLRGTGVSTDVIVSLLDRLNSGVNPELITGEALDVDLEQRDFAAITRQDIETMLHLKTAVLLAFAAETGAMIGLGTPDREHPTVALLGRFAEHAGLAFQLQDDLLGMYGSAAKLGKPIASDLRSGKRTLLFAEGLALLGEADRAALLAALGNRELPEAEATRLGQALRDCGAVARIETEAREHIGKALTELEALPPSRDRDRLHSLAIYLYLRSH